MELNVAVDRAIKACGLRSLAAAFDISPQAVNKWRWSVVPPDRVLTLEQLSGVPRTELRPDLYPLDKTPSDVARRKRA
jgi:DNA-binding transcriptional regulator YdaS (Cro superfamily)